MGYILEFFQIFFSKNVVMALLEIFAKHAITLGTFSQKLLYLQLSYCGRYFLVIR